MQLRQRLAILVDSENLEISVQDLYAKGRRASHAAYPNWLKIIPEIVSARGLVRNIYYKKRGKRVSLKFKELWERELGGEIRQPEKSADPYIMMDAVALAPKVDTVVILAGDKDYLPLIWYLQAMGCKVEVASFAGAASLATRRAADKFHLLTIKDTVVVSKRT